jgi:hypothetical protein
MREIGQAQLGSPPTFQGLIQGNDEALLLGAKGAHQQAEEDMTDLSERPGGSIKDLVVATLVWIVLLTHVPQRSSHSSTATGEKGPHQEDHDARPGAFLEAAAKGGEPRHEHGRQGHRTPP